MTEITCFDKKMFNKYRLYILDKMKNMANFNLSAAISILIGGLNGTAKYDGFFIKANHSTIPPGTSKDIAIEELKVFLELDHILEDKVGSFMLAFKTSYTNSDLSNDTFKQYLAIYPGNMAKSLKKYNNINCTTCHEQIELRFQATQNKNDVWEEKKTRLYLPTMILDDGERLSTVFQGIIKHSVCNYPNSTNSPVHNNIYLEGQSIGKEDCLYAFIIKVFPVTVEPWKMENNHLAKSKNLPTLFNDSGMLKYCDYFIVTCDKNSNYFALPVCTTGKDSSTSYNWKNLNRTSSSFHTRFDKEFELRKEDTNMVIVEQKSNGAKGSHFEIALSEPNMDGNGTNHDNTKKPVIHMLIFDNRNDSNYEDDRKSGRGVGANGPNKKGGA